VGLYHTRVQAEHTADHSLEISTFKHGLCFIVLFYTHIIHFIDRVETYVCRLARRLSYSTIFFSHSVAGLLEFMAAL